jgi:hypothetical protein
MRNILKFIKKQNALHGDLYLSNRFVLYARESYFPISYRYENINVKCFDNANAYNTILSNQHYMDIRKEFFTDYNTSKCYFYIRLDISHDARLSTFYTFHIHINDQLQISIDDNNSNISINDVEEIKNLFIYILMGNYDKMMNFITKHNITQMIID